mgnify:CR=1
MPSSHQLANMIYRTSALVSYVQYPMLMAVSYSSAHTLAAKTNTTYTPDGLIRAEVMTFCFLLSPCLHIIFSDHLRLVLFLYLY